MFVDASLRMIEGDRAVIDAVLAEVLALMPVPPRTYRIA
jgi:hypothetical protein